MKRLISLFAAAALILSGTTPAQAGIVWEYDANWVGQQYLATWSTMDVIGSLREGEAHTVSFSATIPNGATCDIEIWANEGRISSARGKTGTVSGVSNSLVSGAAGTETQYWTIFICTQAVAPTFAGYSSRIAQVTFEVAPQVGAPTNFSVVPQAGATAFATWGIATGATSYTVTATPSGQTCTTTTNSCVVSGLTTGNTYSFSVVGKNGSTIGPAATLSDIVLREPASVGAAVNFSVFPQSGGTAFATWGVASGATSYTVTSNPGGQSCSTSENFCVVNGLTPGSTYSFSVLGKNGSTFGPAVSLNDIVLREPVTVGVGLQGGTWRVGETATAQYVVQGSNATPTIFWHRCDSAVFATPTPPAGNCSVVGSGPSYVLAAGDVGKFVTANVFVNNTDTQGQMTASSNQAVLASGAVAPPPVADPAGKPTIVNIPNPIVSVAGGTQVTITGTGLAGVVDVTVGGLPAIVVSKTDTTLVVQVPISTKIGLADLTVTNDKGSVTSKSAIVYTTNPILKITKTKSIAGFKASSKSLTTAQKSVVKTLITANPTLTQLSCAAKTVGVTASKTELAKAKTLATATCAYAKSVKKTLVTSISASQSLPKAKASRTVLLTLKN